MFREIQKASSLASGSTIKGWVRRGGFEPPQGKPDRFTVCCNWPLCHLRIVWTFLSYPNQSCNKGIIPNFCYNFSV